MYKHDQLISYGQNLKLLRADAFEIFEQLVSQRCRKLLARLTGQESYRWQINRNKSFLKAYYLGKKKHNSSIKIQGKIEKKVRGIWEHPGLTALLGFFCFFILLGREGVGFLLRILLYQKSICIDYFKKTNC